MQYIQFLVASVPARDYAALLPDARQLALDFRVPAEVLFQLYRPVLAAARSSQAVAEDGEIGDAGERGGGGLSRMPTPCSDPIRAITSLLS